MVMRTDRLIELIESGVEVEVDAVGRRSDNLIKIGKAIIAQGRTPRIVNCSALRSDNMLRIHEALGGDVVFVGV